MIDAQKLRIVSLDGSVTNMDIMIGDTRIESCTAITILPITGKDKYVKAVLTFEQVLLDIAPADVKTLVENFRDNNDVFLDDKY